VCHYAQITAGIGAQTLFCGCDGKVALQNVGTGSPPAVFAYQFPGELLYLCDCAPEQVCDRPVCADAACDATLEAPPAFTAFVRGDGLPWPDGVPAVAFDRYQRTPDNNRFIIGSGVMSNGILAFALSTIVVSPTLLVDENADGACNTGEVVLPYLLDLRASHGQIFWLVLADEPPLPCQDRLPVH
jgi:hypothetical protein